MLLTSVSILYEFIISLVTDLWGFIILLQIAGPDLDLWGPLGRLSCGGGGPNIIKIHIFREAIITSTEAIFLRMWGSGAAPPPPGSSTRIFIYPVICSQPI